MAQNKVVNVGVLTDDTRKIINDNLPDISKVTTAFSQSASTTLANVVGLLTDTLQPGVYNVIQLQAAQNVSDATALGSTMSFTPIGATTPLAGALV